MAKSKKCTECKKGAPKWMVTYGDMVTLLLCFFVMLFTVAKIDGREFRLILSAFRGSLGLFEGGQTLAKGKLEDMGMSVESLISSEKGKTLSKSQKIATEIFKPEIKAKKVKIIKERRGLILSLIGSDYFAPGSALLTEEARKALVKVSKLLRQLPSPVRIEGHADENPLIVSPSGERYETNWELASQRAINVLRYLHEDEQIEPGQMSAVSYGKYRPIIEGSNPENRALNRRVDILILTSKKYKRNYLDSDLPNNKIPGIEFDIP